jgi:hypothetical protein
MARAEAHKSQAVLIVRGGTHSPPALRRTHWSRAVQSNGWCRGHPIIVWLTATAEDCIIRLIRFVKRFDVSPWLSCQHSRVFQVTKVCWTCLSAGSVLLLACYVKDGTFKATGGSTNPECILPDPGPCISFVGGRDKSLM